MAYQFETVKLDKGMYSEAGSSFTRVLEKCDPSEQYKGTPLEHLDAFQRQLKRFDIKVKGEDSDVVSKFFATWESAVLFPEYVARAVRQGMEESNILPFLTAAETKITGMDYRSIASQPVEDDKALKAVVCDSTSLTVQQALRDSVEEVSQLRRERIAVVGAPEEETVEELVARAKALASPRVVLVSPAAAGEEVPGTLTAAAVAGAICGEGDPALPLGGAVLQGLSGLTASYSEAELDTLIQGGVTPVEAAGGRISVVRGVTTCTETGGAADNTWRDLSTILVVDYVVPGVRQALQTRFTRTKNTPQVQGAIRSQVILELERYKAAEIITDYGEVFAQALEEAPSVCLVTFAFTVAHGLNQIWLSAQITV